MRTVLMLTVLVGLSISTPSWAIEGVEKATLLIDGVEYTFPIGGPDREMDIFWLKKALKGDEDALDMFMGKHPDGYFWIGDDFPVWLRVVDGKFTVEKP